MWTLYLVSHRPDPGYLGYQLTHQSVSMKAQNASLAWSYYASLLHLEKKTILHIFKKVNAQFSWYILLKLLIINTLLTED